MGYFSKRNIFIYCCVSACLSLITYLVAFSCEVSWILEARGNLPVPSYLLCAEFFILFISSAILIHGLSTGVSWGLLSWSIIIGVLSVPELALVMYMTIQYWGLQSAHGLTELIGYLVRLIVNCLALLCVIPTALRWRQEKKVLSQLESLASRLQLTTPTPTTPFNAPNGTAPNGLNSLRASKRSQASRRPSTGIDNPGYVPHENNSVDIVQQYTAYNNMYGSQSEFNASIFGLNPSQYIGPPPPAMAAEHKKTQSLLDLRFIFPPKFMSTNEKKLGKEKGLDETDSVLNNNLKNKLNNKFTDGDKKDNSSVIEMNTDPTSATNDPIYYTIESTKPNKILGRNCVSLENLGNITLSESPLPYKKNDFAQYRYGNNLLKNYTLNPWNVIAYNPAYSAYPPSYFHYHHMHPYQIYQMYHNNFPPAAGAGAGPGGGYFGSPHHPHHHHHHNHHPAGGYGYGYNTGYLNSANNSRQSLGAESDDFRKYRDVAL
ncbi:uncharacterized protein LOC129746593 [Uranotaenia lowii]|uniref:uncharacterized protein LOC129746593 n=1 Tax=Uranotaenia lowii TaxID=190385 RepID=UPI00247938DB|nr:uncharacterized protein LOC129746593 [Uranotaenia lowii]XP_055596306.1 uncharacterized protein LOC129746593 [Uranotaenia lowii]